ncbi:uncharacterized protein BCR38DRAFT_489222 [Pseudomassariella vexata]|uniref:DUF8021 domain-containing protein n=1 Tax=Pseudomassariella vexata TaxID=1141098 RepID=A0A1Y2DJ80_9PEZI|nr:uncharacterized protein BCR38DRAFT_489222 [Pseudomassariella vexata]ORY58865.1 hypothetical protein BCR38DRAFT_489222 [Pseudomassariella vexata]
MKVNTGKGLAAFWAVMTLGSTHARSGDCDRSCLEALISDYLTALVAHDPSSLPTTPDVKYVENNQVLPLGTGEWLVAGSTGKYRHTFSDPESGQVGTITTITENGVGTIYIVRLQLDDDGRRISEIETQITRDADGAALYEKMGEPESVWLQAVTPEQRIPRATLISQTNKYYSGMERNDPNGNYSFFDTDCNRLEDAVQTTNIDTGDPYGHSNDTVFESLGCEAQFQTGFLGFVTKIRERRFPVVDEERQAVLAITTLDHNGTVRELPSANGTSQPIPAYFDVPRTLQAAEAFRLRGQGKLWRIEMTLTEVPYGMSSPFHEGAPVDVGGEGTEKTIDGPCGRACLEKELDRVLDALLAHHPATLPLAEGVRYSENGQFIPLGDGLWETLGDVAVPGVNDYAARFADPSTGTAAYWGLTREQTTPGVLALRIKVDRGQITEIEAIDVRAESTGARGGTMTLLRPPLPIEWEGNSLGKLDPAFQQNKTAGRMYRFSTNKLMHKYFDGMQRHSGRRVPFAPGCTRRDNGARGNLTCAAQMEGWGVAPNGLYRDTTVVRDRRVLVADAERGVVLAVAMVDGPAARELAPVPETERVPSTFMVPQLIKVGNGTIERVEGMVKWMPFGYTSAWGLEGRS